MARVARPGPAIGMHIVRAHLSGSNEPASWLAGRPIPQHAAPQLIPTGRRAEEVAGGGEKQVRLPLFARQCEQKVDYLRIGRHATQNFTVKRRLIADLVLGKPEIRGRHSRAIFLFHAP
jgi:hypothetical protein